MAAGGGSSPLQIIDNAPLQHANSSLSALSTRGKGRSTGSCRRLPLPMRPCAHAQIRAALQHKTASPPPASHFSPLSAR